MKKEIADFSELDAMKNHPVSAQIDEIFRTVIKEDKKVKAPKGELAAAPAAAGSSVDELSLSDDGEFQIDLGGADELPPESAPVDDGFELSLSEEESLDLAGDEDLSENSETDYGDISLEDEEIPDLNEAPAVEEQLENLGDLSFDMGDDAPAIPEASEDEGLSLDGLDGDAALDLGGDAPSDDEGLNLVGDELSLGGNEELSLGGDASDDSPALSLGEEEPVEELDLSFGDESPSPDENELSADARKKLEEIDALMVEDASRVNITPNFSDEEDLDQPLVGEDINLDSLDFSNEEEPEEVAVAEEKPAPEEKKKKRKEPEVRATFDKSLSDDLREISGAYSGEMERLQATISNLRSDREELLTRIQKLEDEKIIQNRQGLSLRAELDEKKIELTIIRKKLNEEIAELKDRLKLHDEKRLILEEKNKILLQELDKAAQKNKIDVKKIQMREKELEQKLELLKADAETQIRNRDLKILELKRKIDSMEFDMESLSQQEKRSVESRFELEDKLEKAIKTLRNAINVLEDENERAGALSALKKNLDV